MCSNRCCLLAISDVAKSFQGPEDGGPDIFLQESTKLGRSVPRAEGCRLPLDWQQISGQHCRIFVDKADGEWYLEDTSTNGTYVNGERVPKSKRRVLKFGDRIRLSTQVLHSSGVPEYEFIEADCETFPGGDKKRCLDQETDPGSASKRTRYSVPQGGSPSFRMQHDKTAGQHHKSDTSLLQSLHQFQRTNADLRSKLEASRVKQAESEKRSKEAEMELEKALALKNEVEADFERNAQRSIVELDALKSELASTKAREKTLEDKIEATDSKIKLLQESQGSLGKEAADWQVKYENLNSEFQELKRDLEMATKQKESAKESLAESCAHVKEMLAKGKQDSLDLESLREQRNKLEGRLESEVQAVHTAQKLQKQAEKEITTLKIKLKALEAAKSTVDTCKVRAEQEAQDSKRLRDQAIEEAKEAQDKMNLHKAQMNSMASFAIGVASTAQELNQMASELMSRFDGFRAGDSADLCYSETELALENSKFVEQHERDHLQKTCSTQINSPNEQVIAKLHPIQETVGISDEKEDGGVMDDSPMNDAPYSIEKGGSNQSNTAKTWQGGPLSNDRAGNVSKSAQGDPEAETLQTTSINAETDECVKHPESLDLGKGLDDTLADTPVMQMEGTQMNGGRHVHQEGAQAPSAYSIGDSAGEGGDFEGIEC